MYPQNPSDPPIASVGNTPAPTGYGGPNPPAIDPQHPIHNPLSVMTPGEQVICEIRRHPIGILGIYVMTGLVLIVLAILAFIVVPNVIGADRSQATVWGVLLFLLVGSISLGFVLIAHIVYWGNSWVVTSDSITQITQTSLFRKQSSQLSLGNLEDVTAEQDGILQHMFNYGRLRVETAGERSKFLFPFCPNPSYYAKQVLAAREAFEQGRVGQEEQRLYREQGAYQQAYQQPYQGPAPSYQAEPAPNPSPPIFQTPTQPPPPPSYPSAPAAVPTQIPDMPTFQVPTNQNPPAEPAQPPNYMPNPAQPPSLPQNPDFNSYTPPPAAYEPPPDAGVNINTE